MLSEAEPKVGVAKHLYRFVALTGFALSIELLLR